MDIFRHFCHFQYFNCIFLYFFTTTFHGEFIPPPYIIENFSKVPINIRQDSVLDKSLTLCVNPNEQVKYCLDEPTSKNSNVVISVRGVPHKSELFDLASSHSTTKPSSVSYPTYFNICMGWMVKNEDSEDSDVEDLKNSSISLDTQVPSIPSSLNQNVNQRAPKLVWDACPASNQQYTKIFLNEAQRSSKSQLWRQDFHGRLYNEKYQMYVCLNTEGQRIGTVNTDLMLVNNIEKAAVWEWRLINEKYQDAVDKNPDSNLRLCLKTNPNLTAKVIMLNIGANLMVGQKNNTVYERVRKVKQVEGSGRLSIRMKRQGPTKVLEIRDTLYNPTSELPIPKNSKNYSFELKIDSIGISIVGNHEKLDNILEELIYMKFSECSLSSERKLDRTKILAKIKTIQIDNMLKPDQYEPVAVYIGKIPELSENTGVESSVDDNSKNEGDLSPGRKSSTKSTTKSSTSNLEEPVKENVSDSAFILQAVTFPGEAKSQTKIKLFEKVRLSIGNSYIQLEERFILKMIRFGKSLEEDCKKLEFNEDSMARSVVSDASFGNQSFSNHSFTDQTSGGGPKPEHLVSKQERLNITSRDDVSKIYVEYLGIGLKEIKLSINKSTKNQVSEELLTLKSKLNLKFVQFEQASLDIRTFERENVFEEINFITDDLKKHASDQILSQAIKLFGTVDFLGNPVGLISDVKDGFRDLVVKRDLQSFILNSVHGFSNSGAKISGTLSDVVSALNQDSEHNARRAEIKSYGHNSGEHVQSGLTSLLIGFQGMTTSLYQSTKSGVQQRGLVGGFTGVAKGFAGTFTKPIAGIFDFTREMALSVRDRSSQNQRVNGVIKPIRNVRVTTSMNKALQPWNFYSAFIEKMGFD